MTKVLRILNRFNVGGPTYNATYLTKFLSNEYETKLIGGNKDESEASSLYMAHNLGLEPEVIFEMRRSMNPIQDWKAYQEIKKIIKEFNPDIVHTHASKAGAIGRLAAISCKVPVIVHTFHGHVFHGYFNPIITRIYKTVERYLAKKSDAIIAISELQKNELTHIHKIAPAEKISVIPLGFDLDQFTENSEAKRESFRSQFGINEGELAIGIIGRLVPIKNHQLFIKAAKHVQEKSTSPVRFVIIGDGESKAEIQEQCKAADLSYEENQSSGANVIFTSWIKEIDWALAGLDIVCLTSLNEGTPVSLIEAQAAGKPIVTTEVGGIKNVVIPNKSALLSPIENERLFVENLLKLVENQELRKEMSGCGRTMVLDKFSYRVLVKNMEGLYSSLMTR